MKIKLAYFMILSLDIFNEHQTLLQIRPQVVSELIKKKKVYVSETETFDAEEHHIKKHRKYCGHLSPDNLFQLLDSEPVQYCNSTMGSLTAEYGMMDAVSYDIYDGNDSWNMNAYVSAVIAPEEEKRVLDAMDKFLPEERILVSREMGHLLSKALEKLKDEFNACHTDRKSITDFIEVDVTTGRFIFTNKEKVS